MTVNFQASNKYCQNFYNNVSFDRLNSNFEKFKNDQDQRLGFEKDEVFIQNKNVNEKIDETKDDKFSFKVAFKNFAKGIMSPITVMFKHPIATIGTLAGITLACMAAPVLAPVLTVGFGAMSVYQFGKSAYKAISNYSKGNYDQAEKDCENVGQGFIGTALTLLGLKQTAKVAMEAKVIAKTGTITASEKAAIAETVKNGSMWNALKENISIITTKTGLKAVWYQVRPSAIKKRAVSFYQAFKTLKKYRGKKNDEILKMQIEEFQKTAEGQRRLALSDEQIAKEVNAKYQTVFEELGIPKEQQPKIVVKKNNPQWGGGYNSSQHTIDFNPECYKSGLMEMDNVIMHEATHCKEALLRNNLPKESIEKIVADELGKRIVSGESEEIIVDGNLFGPVMGEAPKMPTGMRKDFLQFAKDTLYKEDTKLLQDLQSYYSGQLLKDSEKIANAEKSLAPVLEKLQNMMNKYPEFAKNYKTPEEALAALEKYALSHKFRYSAFKNNNILKDVPQQTITPEMQVHAEQSIRDSISTIEGNARMQSIGGHLESSLGSHKAFDQYQFSPEEVLAQQKGNTHLINNCKAELKALKEAGTLTPEREKYLNSVIKKAEATIEYKIKGQEYYKLYEQSLHEPDNIELAQKVKALDKQLENLELKTHGGEFSNLADLQNTPLFNTPINSYYAVSQIPS